MQAVTRKLVWRFAEALSWVSARRVAKTGNLSHSGMNTDKKHQLLEFACRPARLQT